METRDFADNNCNRNTWGSDNHKDHDDYEDLGNAESKDGPDIGVGSQGGEDSKKTSQQHADRQLGLNQVSCNNYKPIAKHFLSPIDLGHSTARHLGKMSRKFIGKDGTWKAM